MMSRASSAFGRLVKLGDERETEGKFVGIAYPGTGNHEIRFGGLPIGLRHDLAYHSNEFNWGYRGSGAAQSALAILSVALPDSEAIAYYQLFKERFVAVKDGSRNWEVSVGEVLQIVDKIKREDDPAVAGRKRMSAADWWEADCGQEEWF